MVKVLLPVVILPHIVTLPLNKPIEDSQLRKTFPTKILRSILGSTMPVVGSAS